MVWSLLSLPASPGPPLQLHLVRSVGAGCEVCELTLSIHRQVPDAGPPPVWPRSPRGCSGQGEPQPGVEAAISHDLKCRNGSVPYHAAETIPRGPLLVLAFTSSWDFLSVWKALLRYYMPQGWAVDLTLRLRVMCLIPPMWSVHFSSLHSSCSSPLSLAQICSFRGLSVFC